MSTIKEVKVALTDADVEALSRPATRRRVRRRTTAQSGGEEGLQAAVGPVTKMDGAAPLAPTQSPALPQPLPAIVKADPTPGVVTPTDVPVAQPISTAPPSGANPQIGGAQGPVKIQTRKRTHGLHAPVPLNTSATRKIVGGTKIVPVKRHHPVGSSAPATGNALGTLKRKQRLVLGGPTIPVPVPSPSAKATAPSPSAKATAPSPSTPAAAPVAKRRRRFTERRLSISVKNVSTTRKQRRSIKKQVAAMPLDHVRKTLVEKGILKPRSNPPEVMMRSMMADYLSLKHTPA